ncbi:MAG: hypothetical protein M3P44_00275, partial [Actinomycetota bacterium]|nr:hypothetical protein [Actinomycetota bacterium]
AETEAVRRELERERERITALANALPRGRVTELDGQRVASADGVRDRPTTRIAGEGLDVTAPMPADELPYEPDPDAAPAAARHEAEERTADADEVTTIREPGTSEVGGDDVSEDTDTYDHGESVRVLGGSRPRRRATTSTPPPVPPGTAEVGARHIEAGEAGPSAAWIARTVAIAALAVVAVALLMLLKFA